MGYKIIYASHGTKMYNKNRTKRNLSCIKVLVIFAILFVMFISCQKQLSGVLIPGDDAVTTAAFFDLIDNIKSGTPVQDAVASFCYMIFENA